MKYIVLFTLLFSQFAQAKYLLCDGDSGKHNFLAEVNFEENKVTQMGYYKDGKLYKEFSNLSMEKFPFPKNPATYDVTFNQGAFYMEFEVDASGDITGRYIPKNSVFSVEEDFSCVELDSEE